MLKGSILVVVVGLLTVAAPRAELVQSEPPDFGGPLDTMHVVSDHHYRASGAVRPFLLFWITRDNVGGARITRRRGDDGSRAVEMLTGSDPSRAPFGTNRWGYIREVVKGENLDLVAIKTPTDEETIDEAKAAVRNKKGSGVLVFIRERVTAREAVAWNAVADVGRDATFRDLDFVLERMRTVSNWKERRLARPPNVRPGFLTAFTEMMDATAQSVAAGPTAGTERAPKLLTYIHRAELFDLHQDQIELVDNPAAGGRAVRARFRIWNRQSNAWSGDFVAVYGVSGAMTGVPVRMIYQPRWWLRTEMVIDDQGQYSAVRR